MVVPLGSPQPVFALPLLEDIPDGPEDSPIDGLPLVRHPYVRLLTRANGSSRRRLGHWSCRRSSSALLPSQGTTTPKPQLLAMSRSALSAWLFGAPHSLLSICQTLAQVRVAKIWHSCLRYISLLWAVGDRARYCTEGPGADLSPLVI